MLQAFRIACLKHKHAPQSVLLGRTAVNVTNPVGHSLRVYSTRPLLPTDAQRKTIFALSTPPGKGGVAIVRVSGPDSMDVWRTMIRSWKTQKPKADPEPWKLQRCQIVHPESGTLIDDGLAVYFRAPYSFTTQPTIELHIHSGRAVISAVLSALGRIPALRPAEAGEFTRQALLGGRLDLTQVEGLHDLIDADTEVQRLWALDTARGEVRAKYDSLRAQVIYCLAQVEALIDFGEGEDIEEGVYAEACASCSRLLAELRDHLADSRRGELVRSSIKMTIFGPPNAGKSSLFNYFAKRPASIVTHIPGTTRDVIELTLDIGGLPVVVADTAGLRTTDDIVETIGVERGVDAVKDADIRLCVLPLPDVIASDKTLPGAGPLRITVPHTIYSLVNPDTFLLLNKSDLLPDQGPLTRQITLVSDDIDDCNSGVDLSEGQAWVGSLETKDGMSDFIEGLARSLKGRLGISGGATQGRMHAPLITRARHRVHIEEACVFLEAFLQLPEDGSEVVFAAEELRYAARALGKVTGAIDVEDVLDTLFKGFCIGK